MITTTQTMEHTNGDTNGFWNGVVEISRTPSPAARPAKRFRQSPDDGTTTLGTTPDDLGQAWIEQGIIDESLLGNGNEFDFDLGIGADPAVFGLADPLGLDSFSDGPLQNGALEPVRQKAVMQTGCIPCLYV